jgi:hypothetical protein
MSLVTVRLGCNRLWDIFWEMGANLAQGLGNERRFLCIPPFVIPRLGYHH